MKKIVRVEIISECVVDTDWYEDSSDEGMIKDERAHSHEWVLDNILSQKVTIKDGI